MRLSDFNFAYTAYFSCILAVVTAFPSHVGHKSTREVHCQESKLGVELNNKATSVKIVTNSGDTLLSVDTTNTELDDLNKIFSYTTMLFFPEDGYTLAGNNSDYFVIKDPLDDGMKLKVVDKRNETIFTKKIKGSNEGLTKPDVSCAHLSGFKVLVEPGLDVNHLDGYNMTALLWATFLGQTELAKSLVDRGARVNLMGAYGFNALSAAITSGQTDVVEYLIKHGAKVNEHIGVRKLTPLHVAGFKGRLGSTQVLLKHGANVSSIDATNATPLHFAASGGHPQVVKELVGKGAEVNVKNEKGLTPLHMAARSLNEESVHILIQSGADLNSKTNEGATPLIIALEYSSDEDLLLKLLKHMVDHHNPDYSAKNNDGDTVMSLADSKGLKKVQEYLRAHGAQ